MKLKNLIFAFCACSAFYFTAGNAFAQSSAPTVQPAPDVSPAAKTAPKPAVSAAPVLQAAPALQSAPALQAAPKAQAAPKPLSAPKVRRAPAARNAPAVGSSPYVLGGNANTPLPQSSGSSSGMDVGGGDIINVGGPQVPQGTVQITFEEDNTPSPLRAAAAAAGQTDNAARDKAAAGLKAWDKKLTSLKTGFTQTTAYDGTEVSKSSGVLYFSKPSKIRLENLNAAGKTSQITLTDKKKIKIFDAAMKPVQTYDWAEWFDGQPNKAFFDFGNYSALLEANEITAFDENPDGTVTLTLEPAARDQKIFITMSAKDYFPSDIALAVDDMLTVTVLKDAEINAKLPADVFKGL